MSAHVLLNLMIIRETVIKCEFNKFNNTGARNVRFYLLHDIKLLKIAFSVCKYHNFAMFYAAL